MRRSLILRTLYFHRQVCILKVQRKRAFSALCMYSKFRHHPHPLGYLCTKFGFFHGLHCWASLWRKIAYSINHSLTQLIWCPGNWSFRFETSRQTHRQTVLWPAYMKSSATELKSHCSKCRWCFPICYVMLMLNTTKLSNSTALSTVHILHFH